jgi:hypothetical protein
MVRPGHARRLGRRTVSPDLDRKVGGYGKLPDPLKRDVAVLAQQALLHPDPVVAELSVTWAVELTSKSMIPRVAIWVIVDLLSLIFLQASGADQIINTYTTARRIDKIAQAKGLTR